MAYEISDGVYLNVAQVPGYGLLARQPLESLQAGARVEAVEEKRSPLDFVLWKKAKSGEPAWESPWGLGRPGWHTECVVMSLDILGDGFDLHGGGRDLAFPHHENERAQAVAEGRPFARHWVHNGWVEVDGHEDVQVARELHLPHRPAGPQRPPGVPAPRPAGPLPVAHRSDRGRRWPMPRRHWRASTRWPGDFGWGSCSPAARASWSKAPLLPPMWTRKPWRSFAPGWTTTSIRPAPSPRSSISSLPPTRAADAGDDAGAGAWPTRRRCWPPRSVSLQGETEVDDDTARLVAERDDARRAKDFARADALRDELVSLGWTVEDTPTGTAVRR